MASLVRRLYAQESARVERENEAKADSAPSAPVAVPTTEGPAAHAVSALDALEAMTSGDVSVSGSEAPPTAAIEVPVAQEPVVQAAAPELEPAPPDAEPSQTVASGLPREDQGHILDRPNEAPGRGLQSLLGVLRTMGPIFKATMIYPGQDAAPARIAGAVGMMAGVATELSGYLSQSVDVLELDVAWKRKQLLEFTTGLVAEHWISSVLSRGGVPAGAGELPSFSIETFRPALDCVVQALQNNSSLANGLTVSLTCPLAVAQAVAPLSLEVEHFVRAVQTHVPALMVDGDALLRDLVDFVVGQVELHRASIEAGFPELSEAEQHELLHCLVTQFNGILLFAWEQARGEALGVIKDAASAEDAAIALSQPAYQHGVALSTFKALATESIKRLVGTAQYAHARLTPASTGAAAGA